GRRASDHPAVPLRGSDRSLCTVFGGSGSVTTGGEKALSHFGHHTRPAVGWKSNSTWVPQEGQEAECMAIAPVNYPFPKASRACFINRRNKSRCLSSRVSGTLIWYCLNAES